MRIPGVPHLAAPKAFGVKSEVLMRIGESDENSSYDFFGSHWLRKARTFSGL